jgi:hypothetical protein
MYTADPVLTSWFSRDIPRRLSSKKFPALMEVLCSWFIILETDKFGHYQFSGAAANIFVCRVFRTR